MVGHLAHTTGPGSSKWFLETYKIQGILDKVAFDLQVKRALEGE